MKYKYNAIIVHQVKLNRVAIDNRLLVLGYKTILCHHNNHSGIEAYFLASNHTEYLETTAHDHQLLTTC